MAKKKLSETKKIYFKYNFNLNQIEALKDGNNVGKKYNEKSAYDLIKSIEIHDTHISLTYDKKTKEMILDYINKKNKKPLFSLESLANSE